MVLSTREKTLIGILTVLLVLTGVYFGIGAVREHLRSLEQRVATQQSLAQKAAALVTEVRRLEQPRPSARRSTQPRSLIGYVEQLADRNGVKDRIQLNLLPRETSSGLQGLDVRLDRLSLDEAVSFMYTVEDADYQLIIDQLELGPSFRDKDLLRISMRILARE